MSEQQVSASEGTVEQGLGARDQQPASGAVRLAYMRKGFTGAKPERVCRWIADNLGYVDGDDLADLFPGTNSMARALAQLVTA